MKYKTKILTICSIAAIIIILTWVGNMVEAEGIRKSQANINNEIPAKKMREISTENRFNKIFLQIKQQASLGCTSLRIEADGSEIVIEFKDRLEKLGYKVKDIKDDPMHEITVYHDAGNGTVSGTVLRPRIISWENEKN